MSEQEFLNALQALGFKPDAEIGMCKWSSKKYFHEALWLAVCQWEHDELLLSLESAEYEESATLYRRNGIIDYQKVLTIIVAFITACEQIPVEQTV